MKPAIALTSLLILATTSTNPASADQVTWPVNETTTGNNVNYVSPTPTDPDAGLYNVRFVIDQLIATVDLGIFTTPVDITDQLDPSFLDISTPVDGPAPVAVNNVDVAYPPPPATPDLTATLSVSLDAAGFGRVDVTNVQLGNVTVTVPLFGEVTVPVVAIQLIGELTVTSYEFGDVNCDGIINSFDIDPFVLAILDQPGYFLIYPDCSPNLGDINGDGFVNSFDIDPFVAEVLAQP
jgi:hypothetical protein